MSLRAAERKTFAAEAQRARRHRGEPGIANLRFEISNFKSRIPNLKSRIPDFKFQISNLRSQTSNLQSPPAFFCGVFVSSAPLRRALLIALEHKRL
jgi:hypothetical protein